MSDSKAEQKRRKKLAEDHTERRYIRGTNIEVINPQVKLGEITHLICDFDGTISTIRQGWEGIMKQVMMEMICGGRLLELSEEKRGEIEERVEDYIKETTGVQTIVQMKGLREMVDEYGIVPKEERKSPQEYKQIYNQRLIEPVRQRLTMLERGDLEIEDLTIKGSTKFIKRIYEQGIYLYLASGTDREDVINEATKLKVASYFEGRIYGAIGTLEDYSKKQVVNKIIEEHQLQGHQLACIGDGPVEIEETKAKGGISICIASNEERRWGLNERKRKRGILHGADFVIPDFSQWRQLIKLLTFGKSLRDADDGSFYVNQLAA